MRFKRFLTLSFSVLFVVVFALGFLPESVGAVSYYNWISNPSFESNVNLVEDGSFESGVENSGVVYGNWSSGTGDFSLNYAHSGVYAYHTSLNEFIWYNFTEPVLGADIEEFTFWYYVLTITGVAEVTFVYSDASDDTSTDSLGADDVWTETDTDWLSVINDAKYVVAIKVRQTSNQHLYFDDFVMSVYDADTSDAQDEINLSGGGSLYDWWFFAAINMPRSEMGLSTEVYRGGVQSCKMYDTLDNAAPLQKQIAWLDSDSVHYLDLWVMCNDTSVDICAYVYYTGANQYTNRTIEVTQSDEWQHINFGGNWIREGEVITGIRFSVYCDDSEEGFCYFDDVGLWSSVPLGFQRLSYYVAPSPIGNYYNGFHFQLYMGSAHNFYGVLYDENGDVSDENGTVTISHDSGTISAVLTLGQFSYSIPVRSYSETTTEYHSLNINTGSEIVVVEIEIGWIKPSEVDDDDDTDDIYGGTGFWSYTVFFMIVFAPPCIVAGAGSKDGWGAQGFIVTLGLTTVAGVLYLGLPFYVVFLIGMGMAIMLFAMLKRG